MNALWKLIASVGVLVGIGGATYGIDQHQKRKKEQAANRARLQQIETELATKEEELASLRVRLGKKHEQVLILSAEIVKLRNEKAAIRPAA